jgi:hypothetical protein
MITTGLNAAYTPSYYPTTEFAINMPWAVYCPSDTKANTKIHSLIRNDHINSDITHYPNSIDIESALYGIHYYYDKHNYNAPKLLPKHAGTHPHINRQDTAWNKLAPSPPTQYILQADINAHRLQTQLVPYEAVAGINTARYQDEYKDVGIWDASDTKILPFPSDQHQQSVAELHTNAPLIQQQDNAFSGFIMPDHQYGGANPFNMPSYTKYK